ncbi:enoyl-CoA hydratase/isomerase family protein [Paracoccus sp. p4-l81]|uniref:enoyl-CoA hydratase/isomerase family protein n=1 Tax=Paracoccus sp. p4-l81 TaxID=3342806 RepID=UPI0035BA4617
MPTTIDWGTNDLHIRREGRAGRITFTREGALNALSHPMALAIDKALDQWRDHPEVELVLIDAAGDRAFCAGGDIAAMYHAGVAGDFDGPRQFWRDEYRMNAKIDGYDKPIVAFMQGFVMGGGVGVGGHSGHRIVGETTQVAMPETGIGLIPDVGGSLLLARAPGRIGEYLGLTGARMGPGDAIHAGFADYFIPQAAWEGLKRHLIDTGDTHEILRRATTPPEGERLIALQDEIDHHFALPDVGAILASLDRTDSDFARDTARVIRRNAPLSMAATLDLIARARQADTIEHALENEFRFTFRALPEADFLEGVRAQIIDKDRNPRWKHARPEDVSRDQVAAILAPLGDKSLHLEKIE